MHYSKKNEDGENGENGFLIPNDEELKPQDDVVEAVDEIEEDEDFDEDDEEDLPLAPLPPLAPEIAAQFDEMFPQMVRKFGVIAGLKDFKFDLVNPETKEPIAPSKAVEEWAHNWSNLKTSWDRRRYLYNMMLNTLEDKITPWHKANILTAMRRPHHAVEQLNGKPMPPEGHAEYPTYCGAIARTLLALGQNKDALDWAEKAAQADPENNSLQALYADALTLSGKPKAANEIYAKLVKQVEKPKVPPSNPIRTMFVQHFDRLTGKVPSPVFAMQVAPTLKDPIQQGAFWALLEDEYYDSPFFRMQYAYLLLRRGDIQGALNRLVPLVQEMPWLKEAALNTENLLNSADPTGEKLMPEFRKQLRDHIAQNKWTADGMQQVQMKVNTRPQRQIPPRKTT